MDLLSVWSRFLVHLEEKNNSPVLIPLLKKTTLAEIKEGSAFIICENNGIRLFLETKKNEISRLFSSWSGESLTAVFLTKNGARVDKKKNLTIPLLDNPPARETIIKQSGLQYKYTFDNFAVSDSNQIAYSAARAVSDNLGTAYNPLFIYGSVGVGKTHLAQAIANKIIDKDLGKKIMFCTSEEFTNDLIESIRSKNTVSVRKKYRQLDLLIVDDVQFIAGKNYVQEEFYHTFNATIKRGGQIVLTSDRPPREIKKLEDRLRSRFSGGLTIDIQKPDFELRTAIVLIKAKERNIEINMEIAKTIAERVEDARELEGKLLQIYAKMLKAGFFVFDEFNKEEFFKETALPDQKIHPQDILKTICSYYEVSLSQLKSPVRRKNITQPRQIAMYLLRQLLQLTYDEIGIMLKRKDHTTVIHGVNKITQRLMKDPELKSNVDKIIEVIMRPV